MRDPDDMTSFQHLGENGDHHHLVSQYLGNPDTTIVSGESYIVSAPGTPSGQRIYPSGDGWFTYNLAIILAQR